MFKAILAAVLFALIGLTQAQTITPNPVLGIYVPVRVDLPYGGVLRWSIAAVDPGSSFVYSGNCAKDYTVNPVRGTTTYIGFTCAGPSSVGFTTTGQITSTCPYDGATLDVIHLNLTLDGAVLYDKSLLPSTQICYTTPAVPAVASFAYPTVTFDNSAQSRSSAPTAIYSQALLYSQHVFTPDQGVACGPWKRNIGTRWKPVMQEFGFTCSTVVPASAILHVGVQ
jgi:hypothetical protein